MSLAYHKIEKFFFVSLLTKGTCDKNWVRFAISAFLRSAVFLSVGLAAIG
jgi:hypothetical protein